MGTTACSKQVECTKPAYPTLVALDRVPICNVEVVDGRFTSKSTSTVFSTVKALRVSEHYYYSLIKEYTTLSDK